MTHISDMDATQNVHADAATGNAVTGMFYDTHHRDMNAPQYVHTHDKIFTLKSSKKVRTINILNMM